MKVLLLLAVFVASTIATLLQLQSWGLPELEHYMEYADEVDPSLLYCINLAYNYYMNEVNLIDSPKLGGDDLKAVVPSPDGHDSWSLEELKRAATTILENMHLNHTICQDDNDDIRTRDNTKFLEEIKVALDVLSGGTGKVNNTEDLITTIILNTLVGFMEEALENITIVEDGYKIEVPMVDISIWPASAIQTAVDAPTTDYKLKLFLKQALMEPAHLNKATQEYCVLTPINKIVTAQNDYFLPNATKELLYQLKTSYNTTDY